MEPGSRQAKKTGVKRAQQGGRGAEPGLTRLRHRWRAWLVSHRGEARSSLWRLIASPISSVITWLVIGIAIALPAALYVGLNNVEQLGLGWDGAARISLYLNVSVSEAEGRSLVEKLASDPRLVHSSYISATEALQEFRAMSDYGEVLDSLPANPLPAVIVLRPDTSTGDTAATEALLQELRAIPAVEQAQLDMEWVQRLYAITRLGRRGVWILAGLLALGVLLITGNTIRLAIESRREEIVVVKLVGGSDAFVRRPFLYTGLWFGVGGAVFGWLILLLALWWLSGPIAELAGLYQSRFFIQALNPLESLALLAFGAGLGLAGAWLAVSRHLSQIEPR